MKKKRTNIRPICGDQCPNCTYIGDGDFMCDKFDEPIIVLTDFSCPTEDYMRCRERSKTKGRQGGEE